MDAPRPSHGEQNPVCTESKAGSNGESVIRKLLADEGYEPFQDSIPNHGALSTVAEISRVANPRNDNVPFPNASETAASTLTKKSTPDSNSKIISDNLLNRIDEKGKDGNKDLSQQDKKISSSVDASVFQHVATGEDLHLVENLDDITIENIEDDNEENQQCGDESNLLNINDLPQELLHKILTYVTQYYLCHSVACVCKLWRDLAYDPVHWQKLDFKDKNVTPGTLIHCIKRATRLKQLKWHVDLTLDEVNPFGGGEEHLPQFQLILVNDR